MSQTQALSSVLGSVPPGQSSAQEPSEPSPVESCLRRSSDSARRRVPVARSVTQEALPLNSDANNLYTAVSRRKLCAYAFKIRILSFRPEIWALRNFLSTDLAQIPVLLSE